MAAVAAWGEAGAAPASEPGRRQAPPSRGSSGGRVAAILGALIAIASVAATIYVFRDDGALWFKSASSLVAPTATPSPALAKLPPLGSPPATPAPTPANGVETPTGGAPPPASTPTATAATPAHVPTSEELIDALPPRAPQALVALPPATVGKPYRDELPVFADPGGKGLQLKADSPPDGLVFKDLGGGRSEIDGAPTRAGSSSLQVVAVNHNGLTAQMTATIVVADKSSAGEPAAAPTPAPAPPRPSQALAVLEGARVGEDYSTALPPFNVGANARGLALRAEPSPPDGLTFVDLGAGLSEISGKPAQAGAFAFDVVATNSAGLAAHMAVKIVVATAPQPAAPQPATSEPSPARPSATPVDKARAFIGGFDGGACFLVRPLPGAADARALQGVGVELAPFQRFDAGYTREVGVEPQLGLRLIAAAECPALDLIRLGSANGAAAPRIELTRYEVGRGKPLAGTISGLAGRRLVLLLVDNDGVAHRLETKAAAGGDSATFSAPLVADASSVGPLQIVLAIASAKPIAALEGLRSAPLTQIAPRLTGEAPAASAAVEAEFFKLVE
jgi:hypothetical protein